ncbi:M17 family peptidase N-terminal domain-containing protein, partial [Actinoallomurus acaciae]
MTALTVSNSATGSPPVDRVVIGVARSADGPVPAPGPESFADVLAPMLGRLGMTGAEGETLTLPSPAGLEADAVLAVGLGDLPGPDGYDAETLR